MSRFTIRTEAFDNESYGYSNMCDELEKGNKWELVSQEKRVLHVKPDDDKYRFCYSVMTYKVLNNWSVLHARNFDQVTTALKKQQNKIVCKSHDKRLDHIN